VRLFILAALLCGCQGKAPPEITSVDLPTMPITIGADGKYDATFIIHVHDADDLVVSLLTVIPSTGTHSEQMLSMGLYDGPVSITIPFPGSSAKGQLEVDFTLIDQSMLQSVVSKQYVTLQ
jgi:hypothetical protein